MNSINVRKTFFLLIFGSNFSTFLDRENISSELESTRIAPTNTAPKRKPDKKIAEPLSNIVESPYFKKPDVPVQLDGNVDRADKQADRRNLRQNGKNYTFSSIQNS